MTLVVTSNNQAAALDTPPALQAGRIDLDNWDTQKHETITLSGQWRFFPDQLIKPDQVNRLLQQAQIIKVPGSWNEHILAQSFPQQGHGMGTYWLTIEGSRWNKPTSLFINRSCSNATVFFFPGKHDINTPLARLGRTADNADVSISYAGSTLIDLPFTRATTHHLLIQVSNFNFYTGGLCGEILLGSAKGLAHYSADNTAKQSMLITIIIMAALYPLALYVHRRQDPTLMWFTVFCLSIATFFLSISGFLEFIIPSDASWVFEFRTKLTFFSLNWAFTALLMFYHRNFPDTINPSWLRINMQLAICCTLFIISIPAWLIGALTFAFISYWALQSIAALWIIACALSNKQRYTTAMLIAIVPLLLAIPIEIVYQVRFNSLPQTGIYCLLFFILVESQIIAHKFASAFKLAEKLSENLQDEVSLQTAALNKKNQQLEHAQVTLRVANHFLKKLSVTDGLTQLYNRTHFDHVLHKEWQRGARRNSSLSMLMIDVDYFKQLNDSAGHMAGDQSLKIVARHIQSHFKRAGECVARYGGEEFAVILPDTDQQLALSGAETLRQLIEKLTLKYNNKEYSITVSIGVGSVIPSSAYTADSLLQAADAALYDAKNSGRNRVATTALFPAHTSHRQQH